MLVEYIQTKPFGKSNRIALTCNKDNVLALKLFEENGFKKTGNAEEDEIELTRHL